MNTSELAQQILIDHQVAGQCKCEACQLAAKYLDETKTIQLVETPKPVKSKLINRLTEDQKNQAIGQMLYICMWLGWEKCQPGHGMMFRLCCDLKEFLEKSTGMEIGEYT